MATIKKSKRLERHFKGAANHYRIDILLLLTQRSSLSVEDISSSLDGNFKTISQHTRKLARAGLVNKRYEGRNVLHSLSPYGEKFAFFIKTFK